MERRGCCGCSRDDGGGGGPRPRRLPWRSDLGGWGGAGWGEVLGHWEKGCSGKWSAKWETRSAALRAVLGRDAADGDAEESQHSKKLARSRCEPCNSSIHEAQQEAELEALMRFIKASGRTEHFHRRLTHWLLTCIAPLSIILLVDSARTRGQLQRTSRNRISSADTMDNDQLNVTT
jgi:hypothetical protein